MRINFNVGCNRSPTNANNPALPEIVRVVPLIVFAAILCGAVSSRADTLPQPPCGSATFPPYPDLENSPSVRSWDRAESGRDWIPPACTGWTEPGFTTLVVTAARFRHASGVEGLLRRIGAISERAGIRYWSTTHKRWKPLILNAYALSEAAGDRRREDFSPDEMAEGRSLYFQQEDNLSGKGTYRMRIRSALSRSAGVRDGKHQYDAVLSGYHFHVQAACSRYLPRSRVARRLALLQHHAHEQRREPFGGGIRGILHQPGGGILPLSGGHSDGQGAARIAMIFLGILGALIGFSRLYLGVHYLSDVLAGMAAGSAWLVLCLTVVGTLRRRDPDGKGKTGTVSVTPSHSLGRKNVGDRLRVQRVHTDEERGHIDFQRVDGGYAFHRNGRGADAPSVQAGEKIPGRAVRSVLRRGRGETEMKKERRKWIDKGLMKLNMQVSLARPESFGY